MRPTAFLLVGGIPGEWSMGIPGTPSSRLNFWTLVRSVRSRFHALAVFVAGQRLVQKAWMQMDICLPQFGQDGGQVDQFLLAGLFENCQRAHSGKPSACCIFPRLVVVDQHCRQIKFKRQGNRFGFSGSHLHAEFTRRRVTDLCPCRQGGDPVPDDGRGVGVLQLGEDRGGDDDAIEDAGKDFNRTAKDEVMEGASIGNDERTHLAARILSKVARSASRSSRE